MLRKTKLLSIDVERTWTARHSHHNLRIAEAVDGRIWLRLEDLRQWVPGLPPGALLAERHPGMVRALPPSSDPYIEASAFQWITDKSSNVPTLKLLAWLDSTILAPARKRRDWQDYQGTQTTAASFDPPSLGARVKHDYQLAGSQTKSKSTRKEHGLRPTLSWWLDPRHWPIANGAWGLKTVMVLGASGSAAALALSGWVDAKAFDVNNRYIFWAWAAILLSVWAVLFNVSWAVGALRSGVIRSGDGFNPWMTTALVATNLAAAAFMLGSTASNTQELIRTWWAVYVDGDPPVLVTVDELRADGTATRLLLRGPIGIGSTRVLREAFAQNPEVTELVLSSPGGLVIEGFGLAEAVRSSGLKSTMVRDSCASACTLPFIMGDQRVIACDATLGFHRSYSIFGDFGTGWGPAEHRMADVLRARGVSEGFIQKAFSVPGWDMYEPPLHVLQGSGVVTGVR